MNDYHGNGLAPPSSDPATVLRSHVKALHDSIAPSDTPDDVAARTTPDRVAECDLHTECAKLKRQLEEAHHQVAVTRSRVEEAEKEKHSMHTRLVTLQEAHALQARQMQSLEQHREHLDSTLKARLEQEKRRAEESTRGEWQLGEYRRMLDEQQAAYSALQTACGSKESMIAAKQMEIVTLQRKCGELHDTAAMLRREQERTLLEANELRQQNDRLHEKLSDFSRTIAEKDIDLKALHQRLKAKEAEVEDLNGRVRAQGADMGRLEESLRHSLHDRETLRDDIEGYKVRLQHADEDLKRREVQLDRISRDMDMLQTNILERSGESVSLRTQLGVMQDRFKVQERKSEGMRMELQQELQARAKEVASLRAAVVLLEGRVALLQEDNDHHSVQEHDLQSKCHQLQDRVRSCQDELAKTQQELISETTAKAESQATAENYAAQLSAQREIMETLRITVGRQTEEGRIRTRDLQAATSELQQCQGECSRLRAQLHETHARADRATLQLEESKNEVARLQSRILDYQARETYVASDLATLRAEMQNREAELAAYRERSVQLREDVVHARDIPHLRNRIAELTQEVQALQQQVRVQEGQIAESETEKKLLGQLRSELRATSDRNDKLEEEQMRISLDNFTLMSQITEARETIMKLERHLASVCEASRRLQDTASDLDTENKRLCEELNNARKESLHNPTVSGTPRRYQSQNSVEIAVCTNSPSTPTRQAITAKSFPPPPAVTVAETFPVTGPLHAERPPSTGTADESPRAPREVNHTPPHSPSPSRTPRIVSSTLPKLRANALPSPRQNSVPADHSAPRRRTPPSHTRVTSTETGRVR